MKPMKATATLLAVTTLLSLTGCVELTGQRISWFHDEAGDQLHIMLHYDGVHDSGSKKNGKGVEQIATFVQDGSVLLLDWPFHLPGSAMKEAAENADESMERGVAQLFQKLQVRVLGHYREPNGRMGAAQMITIPNLKAFVAELNQFISRSYIEVLPDYRGPSQRTAQKMLAEARNNWEWLTVDGHSISFTLPVQPNEWRQIKGDYLGQIAKQLGRGSEPKERREMSAFLLALASAPISLIDKKDRVTLVLGHQEQPSTLRANVRRDYETSLEETLRQHVTVDIDERLGEALLSGSDPGALAPLLTWGPPEEQVRPLLYVLETGDARRKEDARKHLLRWADQWNNQRGFPEAPEEWKTDPRFLTAWKKWYRDVRGPGRKGA